MKKLLAINGRPRRNGNTAELLKHAIKGCTSCFACKLKSRPHGVCAMKDDLSLVLEQVKTADAIVFGSPIYFMNLSAVMLAFIERLFFSNYIYSDEVPTVFPKKLPSAFIYTMNMTAKHFDQFGMSERLGMYEMFTARILQAPPKILRAFDTVQFKDYSRYESSIFDPDEKFVYREKFFPADCAAAYEIGRDLVSQ